MWANSGVALVTQRTSSYSWEYLKGKIQSSRSLTLEFQVTWGLGGNRFLFGQWTSWHISFHTKRSITHPACDAQLVLFVYRILQLKFFQTLACIPSGCSVFNLVERGREELTKATLKNPSVNPLGADCFGLDSAPAPGLTSGSHRITLSEQWLCLLNLSIFQYTLFTQVSNNYWLRAIKAIRGCLLIKEKYILIFVSV